MSVEDLRVRSAGPEDAAEIRRLSIAFTPSAEGVLPAAFDCRYAQLLADDAWCIAVAERGGRLSGYALAQDLGPGLRADFTTGRVHDLFVDHGARGEGTGRALMDFIFDWARARRQPMILDWQASTSGIAFYEALGFTADRVGDFPDHPGFTLDLRPGKIPKGS